MERGSNQFKPVVIESERKEDVQVCTTFNREEASGKAGVAPRTLASAMKVDRHGAPELVEAGFE